MKRFEFRLAQVLRLKQQRHKLAELRQREAQAARDGAAAEVAKVQARLDQADSEWSARFGEPTSVTAWLGQARYRNVLMENLRAVEVNVRAADESLKVAAAARAAVAKEEETLVALRDQQWREHQREAARQEQHTLDELSLRRWRSARMAAEVEVEEERAV